ncbi:hypothetical protein C0995_013728 [Termitomyces sp. Mi166|nr:hypothetical protein C0995_013728 [Termitomyces sp. Mi166\
MATTTTTTTTTTNPFYSHTLTPHSTGASSAPSSSAAPNSDSNIDSSGLDDELPPAYTAAPDVQHGESTVQYGPHRPFQNAPPPPALPPQRPPTINVQPPSRTTTSSFRQIRDTITSAIDDLVYNVNLPTSPRPSNTWSDYPGRHGSTSPTSPSPRPPPLPPRPTSSLSHSNSVSPPTMSDFIRDFYTAGTGEPAAEHQRHASTSSGGSTPSSSPTKTPTPGRPLLRDGKLLVYPKGFLCQKCNNTGYKHADPLNPCKKCWSKHAKPFSGPLAYAYSAPASSSQTQTTFQRPLPTLLFPRSVVGAPLPPPPPPPPPQPQPQWYPRPPTSHPLQPHPHLRTLSPSGPPPGALVYVAGDPRLGGRACWNCGGKGSESFFLLGSGPCLVCKGVGRVYT